MPRSRRARPARELTASQHLSVAGWNETRPQQRYPAVSVPFATVVLAQHIWLLSAYGSLFVPQHALPGPAELVAALQQTEVAVGYDFVPQHW